MDDNVKPMTVADFVAFLQTQPQELVRVLRDAKEQDRRFAAQCGHDQRD